MTHGSVRTGGGNGVKRDRVKMFALLPQAEQLVGQLGFIVQPPGRDFAIQPGQKTALRDGITTMGIARTCQFDRILARLVQLHGILPLHQHGTDARQFQLYPRAGTAWISQHPALRIACECAGGIGLGAHADTLSHVRVKPVRQAARVYT
jgi:hypothetical protein